MPLRCALREAETTAEELEQKKMEGKFKLTVEEQARLGEWEGMFMDFKQMVVQFGYLALFAPACSLAVSSQATSSDNHKTIPRSTLSASPCGCDVRLDL